MTKSSPPAAPSVDGLVMIGGKLTEMSAQEAPQPLRAGTAGLVAEQGAGTGTGTLPVPATRLDAPFGEREDNYFQRLHDSDKGIAERECGWDRGERNE